MILNLRNSGNTFLYKKLSSGDAAGPVTAQQLRGLPMKELRILHSISQLTGVQLERAITAYLGVDTRDLAVIPREDQAEVQWTRRTLHEYVNYTVFFNTNSVYLYCYFSSLHPNIFLTYKHT